MSSSLSSSLSSSSSVDVCDRFQQHTWRKDTCANCLKPRKQHSSPNAISSSSSSSSNPQPAKRLSKATNASAAGVVVVEKDDTQTVMDEGQVENNIQTEVGQVRVRQASVPDAKRLSNVVGSPKPAPLKAKPQMVISKPEKAKKPGLVSGEKTSMAKRIIEEEPLVSSQDAASSTPDATRDAATVVRQQDVRTMSTGDNQSDGCDVEVDREPVNTAQRTTKARPRPQVTPPQVPDPSKIPNTTPTKSSAAKADVRTTTVKPKSSSFDALDARTKNSASSSDSKTKSSGSHYYQIYDISAKGLSGTPEPVDVSEQNGVGEAAKRTDAKGTRGQTAACRVVDVVDEAQNVAMPYTIVDVTVCQPNKDQLMSKAPPQLPLTPAPIRDCGATSSAPHSNTMPTTTTNRPRSTRDGSDLLRHTTPKSTHDPSSKSGLSNQTADHVCSGEGGGPSSSVRGGGTAVLPLDGKFLVGKKMANQDLYEDIASSNVKDNDKHSSSSSSVNIDMNASHLTTTTIVAKSSALEAKMAALSKLDLSRTIAPQGTSTLPARTDDLKLDTLAAAAAADRQDAGETNEVKSGEIATVITLNRQEKGRKSGGKSFFQKFLKRGNKETETSQGKSSSSSSSALNITIEPIINTMSSSATTTATTTAATASGQSSLELVVTRSSTVVVNDSPLNSSSPSKTFVNKPPLLPIASPAKKSQPTNDVSEATDSSAGSSVSSSEESCGKLAEKSTMFEQLSERLLTDKDESISSDLRKVSPAKLSVDRTQSPKSIGIIILNNNASTDVVMNPTRESLAAGRDKLKSCSSLSRIPDETKQSLEEKTSFAESLRDALALKMSERDSAAGGGGKAAAAAALDLSPTSDGTDVMLNCLNSEKCKVQKDALKPSKAPRKMMAPPPMAPPPPPPPSNSHDGVGNSSSPKHVGSITAETDHHHATRSLSPLFHGLSSSSSGGGGVRQTAFPLSNTLPRKSSSSSSPSNNSTTTLKIAAGTIGLRQLDSAAKHARNKTVSEGVRFEKLLITAQEELGDEKTKNHLDDVTFASETLDRRASKFLNRALPAPPPNESPPPDLDQNCLDEIDNLYELVSQSDEPAKDRSQVVVVDEQLTYEDIDLYCTKASNGNGSKTSSTSSSQRSTSAQATNLQKQGASSSDPSALPSSNYYLEPVDGKEESDSRGGGGRGMKDDWRPCPAPRGSHLSKVVGVEQTAIMSYVNTRMINGQTTLPLNTSDGFDAMAGLIVNMLYHLTDRLYTTYVTRFLKNRSDVFWTDFELRDYTPRIVQENASFYQAKHLVLAPSGCILMVTRETHHHHQGSSFSLEPMQANVISPLLCFAMTTSDFDTLNASTTDDTVSMTTTTTTTSRNATVAVLLCSDVATLDDFWEREHAKVVDESTTIVFEQSVCLCLVQILNALLYLRDSGCTVLRLSSADVIMTQSSSDVKWHPVVRPSVMTFDICSDHDSAFLAEDISQLLFQMLRIESSSLGKVERQESKIVVVVPGTRYSRGLQRVLRLFAGVSRTWEALETGRNLLEFILWGPSEEEAKFVAMTDKRDTSFRVWLEVARCRMASELVLELEKQNLELANQAKFLCRVTENSLLGVTKLLFE